MYCANCYCYMNEDANFCPNCGCSMKNKVIITVEGGVADIVTRSEKLLNDNGLEIFICDFDNLGKEVCRHCKQEYLYDPNEGDSLCPKCGGMF